MRVLDQFLLCENVYFLTSWVGGRSCTFSTVACRCSPDSGILHQKESVLHAAKTGRARAHCMKVCTRKDMTEPMYLLNDAFVCSALSNR